MRIAKLRDKLVKVRVARSTICTSAPRSRREATAGLDDEDGRMDTISFYD